MIPEDCIVSLAGKICTISVFWPTGDLLIILAQIIAAVQMVLEEKFVYKHDVHPLRAVGTEGTAIVQMHSHVTF